MLLPFHANKTSLQLNKALAKGSLQSFMVRRRNETSRFFMNTIDKCRTSLRVVGQLKLLSGNPLPKTSSHFFHMCVQTNC